MNRKWCTAVLAVTALAALVCAACSLGESEEAKPNIVRPYISIQPQSASYYTDAYVEKDLEIEIWEWNNKDGTLRYQWYTFEDIEEYCDSGGTPVGEGGPVYTPPPPPEEGEDPVEDDGIFRLKLTPGITTPVADKQYFYYAVITNRNTKAGDAKEASIQSDIAVISFSAPGKPMIPVISRQPANATYGWGAAMNTLKVNVSLPAGAPGLLSYQWYFNKEFNAEDGEEIEQANQSTLMPDFDQLTLGPNNNYYVVVTNTVGADTATTVSVPATITIRPGVRAAAPRIEQQPADQMYFTGDIIRELRVSAVSLDRGKLSYQWYRRATNSNTGGTAISGADKSTYIPPNNNNNTANGIYFYYVVVTNTNDNVRGTKTARVNSKAAQITRKAAAANETANLFVTIPDPSDPANRNQYIRGYGGMDVAWGNFPRTYTRDTELMYDPNRLGYNILRIMIKPNYVDIEKTMAELLSSDRPDYYENVKIVNKYGGYVAASPWSPPKEWKSNNSVNGGGRLIPGYYKLFANYLRNFAQHMYNNDAPIYCISISNEPNYVAGYDGCEWTPDEMRDFYKEVGHFTDGIRGYGGGRELPYVLTMNGESANTPNINLSALRDPQSKGAIDLLARHIYGERTVSLWNTATSKPLLQKADGSMFEVWMTEHNINSANASGYYNDSTWKFVWKFMNDIDLVIRQNNENAFVWWASKRFYSMVGDGQFGTTDGDPYPRGWGLSHYSRFSIDTTRINIHIKNTRDDGARNASKLYNSSGGEVTVGHTEQSGSIINNTYDDMDNTSARITGFVSQDGTEISLVMWTPTDTKGNGGYSMGTVEIDLPPGFEARSATAVRSWGDNTNQMFQVYDNIRLSADRKTAYVNVPRGNIVSVKFTKR